jgi:deoxycytidylate deaminase
MVSGGDGHGIIAEGYNGTPSGFDNECENEFTHQWAWFDATRQYSCGSCQKTVSKESVILQPALLHTVCQMVTKAEVLHAESNAIAKVAKSTNSSLGATLYVTCSPCYECSKMIIQAGVKRVVYEEEYRLTDGIDLLRKANIEVVKL